MVWAALRGTKSLERITAVLLYDIQCLHSTVTPLDSGWHSPLSVEQSSGQQHVFALDLVWGLAAAHGTLFSATARIGSRSLTTCRYGAELVPGSTGIPGKIGGMRTAGRSQKGVQFMRGAACSGQGF